MSRTDNVEYGFDPHDDSDYIHIVGNDVWGNGELSRLGYNTLHYDLDTCTRSVSHSRLELSVIWDFYVSINTALGRCH